LQSGDTHRDTFVTVSDALSNEYTFTCDMFNAVLNWTRNTAAPSGNVRMAYSDAFNRPSTSTDSEDTPTLNDIDPYTSDTADDSAAFKPEELIASTSTMLGDAASPDTLPNDNSMHCAGTPRDGQYTPPGHSNGLAVPSGQYVPDLQNPVDVLKPVELQCHPAGHQLHMDRPVVEQNAPAGHATPALTPLGHQEPTGQAC
jgi:hypothetical protein